MKKAASASHGARARNSARTLGISSPFFRPREFSSRDYIRAAAAGEKNFQEISRRREPARFLCKFMRGKPGCRARVCPRKNGAIRGEEAALMKRAGAPRGKYDGQFDLTGGGGGARPARRENLLGNSGPF